MDLLNYQLLALMKSQYKTVTSNMSASRYQELYDLYNAFLEENVTDFDIEELQHILKYHYNRTLLFNYQQQRNTDQDCHPFGPMFEVINSYYLPSIIFVGWVGNLLSCIVFLNTHLKMRSSSYYLAALACADFGFLFALFFVWLNFNLELPVFNKEGYCQFFVYVSSVCSFLSAWLIAAFTVERFIAVQYPLHRPHMCTVARAKAIVVYLVCISLTVNTYVFVTSGIIKLEDGSQFCEMLEGYRGAMIVINIVDSILTLIVPLILIIVMNAMIIFNLIKFSKRFKRPGRELEALNFGKIDINMENLGSSSSNNSSMRKNVFVEANNSTRSNNSFRRLSQFKFPVKLETVNSSNPVEIVHKDGKCTKISSDKKLVSTRSQHTITKMLLLISSVFVLLNLPSYAIRLYVFVFFSIWSESPPVLLWCLQQSFMALYYTNFSINFLLYSMCGITFRRCLWQLVRKKLKKISRYRCRNTSESNG